MKPRSLLILFLIVIALGAFIFFYERKLPSTDERAKEAKEVFPGLKQDEVTGIALHHGKEIVKLKRIEKKKGALATGPSWELTAPLKAHADQGEVSTLLSTLTDLRKDRTLRKVSAKDVGLDQPRATLTIETKGGGPEQLLIGGQVPAGSDMVVARGKKPPYFVVSDALWGQVSKSTDGWRSKKLFFATHEDVSQINLSHGGKKVSLTRRGDQFWLESPIEDRADHDEVEALLGAITGMRVKRFLDSPPPGAELGLASPAAGEVQLVLNKKEQPFKLEWGETVKKDPKAHYAKLGDQVFETDANLSQELERSAEQWRSRSLSPWESWRIAQLTAVEGDKKLELVQKNGEWYRGKGKLAYTPVSDLLSSITEPKADTLVSAAEAVKLGADLNQPAVRFDLRTNDGKKLTITFYQPLKKGKGLVPARSSDRETVLLLPGKALSKAEDKLDAVRKAKATPPPGAKKKGETEAKGKAESPKK